MISTGAATCCRNGVLLQQRQVVCGWGGGQQGGTRDDGGRGRHGVQQGEILTPDLFLCMLRNSARWHTHSRPISYGIQQGDILNPDLSLMGFSKVTYCLQPYLLHRVWDSTRLTRLLLVTKLHWSLVVGSVGEGDAVLRRLPPVAVDPDASVLQPLHLRPAYHLLSRPTHVLRRRQCHVVSGDRQRGPSAPHSHSLCRLGPYYVHKIVWNKIKADI